MNSEILEVTEVQFDDKITSYGELLDYFWKHHDPTKEHKKQYKSAILYVNDRQKKVAEESLNKEKVSPEVLEKKSFSYPFKIKNHVVLSLLKLLLKTEACQNLLAKRVDAR